MSIIADALKKAIQEKERNIQPPQKPSDGPSTKEDAHWQKPKTEIPEYSIQKSRGSANRKKVILLYTLLISGVIIIISLGLSIVVKQNIKDTTHRSLPMLERDKATLTEATEQKDEITSAQPLKALHQQSSVEDSSPRLPEKDEFVLTGIVHGEGSPLAIINGSVYMVGDRVGTAKIIEISRDTVVLERDGQRLKLKVK